MLKVSPHLTQMHDDATATKIAISHPGMAHFASTGPKSKTCQSCVYWAPEVKEIDKKLGMEPKYPRKNGKLEPLSCAKYREIMGFVGEKVPHDALACKHFVAKEIVPEVSVRRS